ncbi:hypothetical protein [Candidatus Nitrosocosmicus franklandus]|uniref:Uncharacterized protein n=1 Tax=Candidatus Nitrosocosmicus franklandianus TaxID=1798806 RepID=A0A484I898_9ARCH|nr:hypothetical protein [Candidatus Nitrosocosmicus franklandus]VFJ12514.1 conserved exported protein of unknown function [Candidatus Nitrosocosmicus franklandus]
MSLHNENMIKEFSLLLILGILIVTSSTSMSNPIDAQLNSSDTNIGNNGVMSIGSSSGFSNTNTTGMGIDDIDSWDVVSGNWINRAFTIQGGLPENSGLNRIILYPESGDNFVKISTSFKVNNLNSSTYNYASIVYSYLNPDNFKLVGINIHDNAVYAIGFTMRNGIESAEPFWPGVPTNLTWSPGTTYNLTMVKQGSSLDLLVNDTKYLTQNNSDNQTNFGDVGVSYGRINNITFFDFETEITDQSVNSNNSQRNTNPGPFTTSDSQAILLEGNSLPENEYLHLYDTTPYRIESGHVAAKLPCGEDNMPEAILLAGQAPTLAPIDLEFVNELSIPDEMCLYHADINSSNIDPITDIAIANNSTDEIDFPETSGIVISISEISMIEPIWMDASQTTLDN